MIHDLLSALGRMNLAIAACVLLVLVVRPMAVRLFGARVRYGLWSVVPVAAVAVLAPVAHRLVRLPSVLPAVPNLSSVTGFRWTEGLILAWGAGVIASLILTAWRQQAFLRGASRRGPAVVGLIRPRIHLPTDFEDRFSPAERDLILTHERCHLARQDARVNGALALAQCAFWFNPAVHLGGRLARQDQEMACDEMVLARYPAARKAYAEALLKTQIASAGLPLGCYWPARGRLPLEARIKMLKTPARGRARRLAGAATVSVLAAGCGYAAWAAQPGKVVLVAATDAVASPRAAIAADKRPPVSNRARRVTHGAPRRGPASMILADPAASVAATDLSLDGSAETAAPFDRLSAPDPRAAVIALNDGRAGPNLSEVLPPAGAYPGAEASKPRDVDEPRKPDRSTPGLSPIPTGEQNAQVLTGSVFHSVLVGGMSLRPF